MPVTTIFEKLVYGVGRRLGQRGRRWAWNKQFRGRPGFASSRSPPTIQIVERLAQKGLVVELGCGNGILAKSIDPFCYSRYLGYDVSDVAIAEARKEANVNCHFFVCDIVKWRLGADTASLIIIEEALYYLTPNQQRALLAICSASLAEGGRVLVVVHSEERHRKTLQICEEALNVEEKIIDGLRVHLVLSPHRDRRNMDCVSSRAHGRNSHQWTKM